MRKIFGVSVVLLFGMTLFLAAESKAQELPHLQRERNTTQFKLHGKPFLMLGGELSNSAAGTAEAADSILPKLAHAHLNTVVTPVSWELIEPADYAINVSMDSALGTLER